MQKKIGIIAGSLRKKAYSRMMAAEMASMLKEQFDISLTDISELPMYNQDYDAEGSPASYEAFRHQVESMDGIIFITPEYNRSLPAVLKNALDVASRPWGQSKWGGKKAMVIGITPGTLGAAGAAFDLRKVLAFLNMDVMGQPEAYLSRADQMFDESGALNAESRAFVASLAESFAGFMNR